MTGDTPMTTAELVAAAAQLLALLAGAAIAANTAWRKWVRPLLDAIHKESAGANKAVNNVPPGSPSLVDRVEAIETNIATLVDQMGKAGKLRRDQADDIAIIKRLLIDRTPPDGTPTVRRGDRP